MEVVYWHIRQNAVNDPLKLVQFAFQLRTFNSIAHFAFLTGFRSFFQFGVLCQQVINRDLILFQLSAEILYLGKPFFQKCQSFHFLITAVEYANLIQHFFNLSGFFGKIDRLFEKSCRNVLPACFAGTLATLQIGIFLYHVGIEIVLPLRQIFPVTDNLFGTQAFILCQRYKGQMKMGCFLVHVDYRRDDIFPAHTVNEEITCPLEKGLYCLRGFSLKELWACGNQRIHKFGAVPGSCYTENHLACVQRAAGLCRLDCSFTASIRCVFCFQVVSDRS